MASQPIKKASVEKKPGFRGFLSHYLRLGRDLHHLVNTVHDLTAQGIRFKVLTG
jgi:hypothetical protein